MARLRSRAVRPGCGSPHARLPPMSGIQGDPTDPWPKEVCHPGQRCRRSAELTLEAPRPLYKATGGTGFKGHFFYKLFLSEFQESVPVTSVCGLNQHRPGRPRSPPFVPSPLFLISCSQRGCMFFCVKLSEG